MERHARLGLGARKVWSVVSGGDLVQDTYGGYIVQLHWYPDTLPPVSTVSTVSTCTGTLAVITLQLPTATPPHYSQEFPGREDTDTVVIQILKSDLKQFV